LDLHILQENVDVLPLLLKIFYIGGILVSDLIQDFLMLFLILFKTLKEKSSFWRFDNGAGWVFLLFFSLGKFYGFFPLVITWRN